MSSSLITNGYQIEPNKSFDLINIKESPIIFTNTAENVTHNAHPANSISASEISFSFRVNDQFFERTPVVAIGQIPLKFTRSAVVAGANKDNFVSNFFNNYTGFAIAELGFANCVESITINIDGFSHTISRPAEILRALIPYYGKDEVYKYIDHSLPDIHCSFDYNSMASTLKAKSAYDHEFALKLPDVNTLNPFVSSFNDEYGTRLPNLSFDSFTANSNTLTATLNDVSMYLVPSFFNVPAENTKSLYNVRDVTISLKLKSNWANELFCSNKDELTYINDVVFDQPKVSKMTSQLFFKSFIAPNYIETKRLELQHENYAMNYPMCEVQASVTDVVIPKFGTKTVNVQNYMLKAIPKYIVVYAIPKVDDTTKLFTPHNYARVNNLSITLNGKQTTINQGALSLYHMCKENGLGMPKEIALYTRGCACMVDVSNNLGLKTNSLIGTAESMKTLSVAVELANLNPDLDVTYEVKTMLIYDTILFYNSQMKKLEIIESFDISTLRSMAMHIEDLYDLTIKDNVVLGGSFWSVIGEGLKKFGKGAFNVIKNAITNKNGFRDKIVDAFNDEGGAVIYSNSNTVGGNVGATLPIGGTGGTGGRSIQNWGLRK